MNCGIALFIYDRPQCTERVLHSLKRNHIKELYVFQDGVWEKTNQKGWIKNEHLINAIDWCTVHFDQNKDKADCLDEQIIRGINKVFEQKEEIIVIEDDCVVSDDFVIFMEKCFDVYRHNENVLDISGYLEPITIPVQYTLSVLGSGIPAGGAWGTWKDRWENFQKDYALVKNIGNAMKDYTGFSSFGYCIKKILTDYWLLGTWDLWWCIYVLERRGISIRPVRNKVHNIGFENPGTHTSGSSPWVVPISDTKEAACSIPEKIAIEPWAEREFKKFYEIVSGGISLEERQTYYRNCLEKWLALKQRGKSIVTVLVEKNARKVVVYGTGTIGKLLIDELEGNIEIKFLVVTNKEADKYQGYPVYNWDEKLPDYSGELALVVIPGYDIDKISRFIGNQFSEIYTLENLVVDSL